MQHGLIGEQPQLGRVIEDAPQAKNTKTKEKLKWQILKWQ
jgi:hypothetical protein